MSKENRERALEIFLRECGMISPSEIAEEMGGKIPPATIRGWKSRYKWDAMVGKETVPVIPPPFKEGNKAQAESRPGTGVGNQASVTSGVYVHPRESMLAPEQIERIHRNLAAIKVTANSSAFITLAKDQLYHLYLKEADLENKIWALQDGDESTSTFLDKRTIMKNPDGSAMTYHNESSKYTRRSQLEEALQKTQREIAKYVAEIREQEEADRRHEMEQARLQFNINKAMGIYSVNEDGEMIMGEEEDEIIEE